MASTKKLVAVVSGGSSGIGFAIADKLSKLQAKKSSSGDKYLYDVVVLSRVHERADKAAKLLSGNSHCHIGVCCDVADPSSVASCVKEIKSKLGSVNVLVNAAGVNKDGLLVRTSNETFLETIHTNLLGPMYLSREVLKDMLRQQNGVILNIGSVVGITGNAGQTVYSASKAGLYGFTKSLAKEVSGRGIRVNLLEPGFVETTMTQQSSIDVTKYNIAMGRMGRPEEIADAALFMIGSGSSYMTGQRIIVDGGMV
uniref:3-oxoacyl-[acyl-carrier-protein] reductase n=1 Tax=Aplanochytrium stocchinoi TaxID=215587 RepID=A0A7S3PL87_9STRA|mmetsp:Transcript_3185/g.4283  ORF Transcript_3185/g.4283 Transcript_3185/m.4283 type:complete len:255 (+) Transcript_3185:88-852(+)